MGGEQGIPVITYSVGLFGALNQNRLLDETVVTHRAIVDAIVAHDSEMARIAMIQHLLKNKETLDEMARLRESDGGDPVGGSGS